MAKEKKERKETIGLKRLRKGTGKDRFACDNCKCTRQSPCTCMRSEKAK
jgi:hypothetical protein